MASVELDDKGTLWVTTDDVEKVGRVIVMDDKSHWCLTFYTPEAVVRCKDCRKWCICHKSDDFYCADGERREDADN